MRARTHLLPDAHARPTSHPHTRTQAVVFVRPTRENVTALKRELRKPRYQSYTLREFC